MEHAQIRQIFGQHLEHLVAHPGDLPVSLRPHQHETLESAVRWLQNPEGTRRSFINHATGLGKTVIFASMAAAASGMRSLVVVPTKLLLVQTARVIARFTGGVLGHLSSLAHIQDDSGETIAIRGLDHSPIVLTTDASFNKLAPAIRKEFDPHIILRDECHWGYIDSALAALNEFPEAVIIGFSATPDFLTNSARDGYTPVTLENGQVLYGPRDRFAETHFKTCLDRRTIRWGIESGWLCPLAWGRIEFDVPLKEVRVIETPDGADYDQGELQKMMGKHWSVMCETVRRLYENHEYELANRQAYAVCPSVDAAEELAQAVGSLGIPTACVTGATPDMERDILLQAYRENEIRFLTSVMVLREGWDAPNAEVCMMLRPTKSRVLYEQAMGRVLRPRGDGENKVALVLDAHFQSQTFYPLSAPELYAQPGDEIRIGDFLIGGGGGGVRGGESDSPYLPKDAQPRLVVVETYGGEQSVQDALPLTDHEGILRNDAGVWATIVAAKKRLRIGQHMFKVLVSAGNIRTQEALVPYEGRGKHQHTLYSLDDLSSALSKLAPLADEQGFFQDEDGAWGSTPAVRRMFGLRQDMLYRAIVAGGIRSKKGRTADKGRGSKVLDFYHLDDISARFGKVSTMPQADRSGTFVLKGRLRATVPVIAKRLDLVENTVRDRLTKAEGLSVVEGKDVSGQRADFYILEEAVEACADLLKDVPIGGEDGLFIIEGEVWATLTRLGKLLGLKSLVPLMKRVARSGIRFKEGRIAKGSIEKIYPLSKVKALCMDLLPEGLPIADDQGLLEHAGEEWVTITRICSLLGGLSREKANVIIADPSVRSCQGRIARGRPETFYSVLDVKRVFDANKHLAPGNHRKLTF